MQNFSLFLKNLKVIKKNFFDVSQNIIRYFSKDKCYTKCVADDDYFFNQSKRESRLRVVELFF